MVRRDVEIAVAEAGVCQLVYAVSTDMARDQDTRGVEPTESIAA